VLIRANRKLSQRLDSIAVLALLYDVHGNLPALEAVLSDADAAGADRFVLGGDYAVFGAWPGETVARLRGLDASWIRGNVDRWAADPGDEEIPKPVRAAVARCGELLDSETIAELAALPEQLVLEGVRYCHASPLSDMRGFSPDPDESDADLLAGAAERRVVFGHTHLQFARKTDDGIELVNPGSVGIPLDGDRRAAYALVDDDGSIDMRRVAYDFQASADAVRERLGSSGEIPARRIEQARF
jgi:diadenosine tetraphosphatase ApaH/serine/threonine PP2A family protein phosphatase